MSEYRSEPSIKDLIRGVLDDTRELIREEIALARAELREELSKARTAAIAIGAAAVAGVIGVVMLCVAAGGALALVTVGKKRLTSIRALPKTVDSLKENVEWVQTKSVTS